MKLFLYGLIYTLYYVILINGSHTLFPFPGIGIDNMFVLLSGLSGAQHKTTVADKMAETLRCSGVGITITTLSDLLAFVAGSFTNYIAVNNFCLYTGKALK